VKCIAVGAGVGGLCVAGVAATEGRCCCCCCWSDVVDDTEEDG